MVIRGKKYLLGVLVYLGLAAGSGVTAQTWYPAGFNNLPAPVQWCATGDFLYTVHPLKTIDSVEIFQTMRFDGTTWNALPVLKTVKGGQFSDMKVFNGQLLLAGHFTLADGTRKNNCLVRMNGKEWIGMGQFTTEDTTFPSVNALELFNGELYAGGTFRKADGNVVNNLVRINSVWAKNTISVNSIIGTNGPVNFLSATLNELAIGGAFTKYADQAAQGIALIGKTFAVNSKGSSPGVYLRGKWMGSTLVVLFENQAQQRSINKFSSGTLTPMMNGLNSVKNIRNFVFNKSNIYAFGDVNFSGINGNRILKFDVSLYTWTGVLTPNRADFLFNFRDELFCAGSLSNLSNKQPQCAVAQYFPTRQRVGGRVYLDVNNNCKYDLGDRPLIGRPVVIGPANLFGFSGVQGFWEFLLPQGKMYTARVENPKYWQTGSCVPGGSLYVSSNADADTFDFPTRPSQVVQDLEVELNGGQGWKLRQGYTEQFGISYRNNGTQDAAGKVVLKFDPRLTNLAADPKPDVINQGQFTWNLNTIAAGSGGFISLSAKVGTAIPLNEILNMSASCQLNSGTDPNPADNSDTIENLVTTDNGIFSKYVVPRPQSGDTSIIWKGEDEVRYVIAFENQGADTVQTVVVTDTIDLTHYMLYIQETGASHSYTTQVVSDPYLSNKGILIWTFKDISLPPNPLKNPENVQSRGYIGFKVKFKSTAPVGSVTQNQAAVKFDLAAPNLTNAVWCELRDNTSSVTRVNFSDNIRIYPVPAAESIHFSWAGDVSGSLALYDLTGKLLVSQSLKHTRQSEISVRDMAEGIYLASVVTEQGSVYTAKVMVKH